MLPNLREPTDAIQEFLGLRLIATLGTTNPDGTIQLTPLWFLYEAGRLYLPTGSASRKARNVAVRPAVSVLIDQRRPDRHRWVSATGAAEIIGGSEAAAINARVRRRYVSITGEETYGQLIADYDDVTIVVTPDRWRSWTPTALDRLAAEHGLSDDQLATWFQPWD